MNKLKQSVRLAYRLPREPSTPRIALWRKLRHLGVAQMLDSLVALPLDSRNREQLEWLADEVIEAGGEASLWVAEPTSAAQERELITRLTAAIAVNARLSGRRRPPSLRRTTPTDVARIAACGESYRGLASAITFHH